MLTLIHNEVNKPIAKADVKTAVNEYQCFGQSFVSEPTKSKISAPANNANNGEIENHSIFGPTNAARSFTWFALQHVR